MSNNQYLKSPPLYDSAKETIMLLEKIKNGDEKAFDTIYLRWYEPICNFLKVFTRDKHDAEDLAQDVFATLWRKRETIDTSKNGKSFLFTLARYTAADFHRKKSAARNYATQAKHESEEDISSQDVVIAKEMELITEYAIRLMPRQRQEVYLLSYKEGLKSSQIAEQLGIPEKSVRNHLYQARIYLKELLPFLLLLLSLTDVAT